MPAFDLPTVGTGLPTEGGVPYLGAYDSNNKIVQVAGMYFKNASGLWVPVSHADPLPAEGKVADDAAATGKPVVIGGKYSATPATRHDGDAVTLQMSPEGAAHVQLTGSLPAGTAEVGKIGLTQTELARRTRDAILSVVGFDVIKEWWRCNEASGTELKGLRNPENRLKIIGAALGGTGLIDYGVTLDGVSNALEEKPLSEQRTYNTSFHMTSANHAIAEKLPSIGANASAVAVYVRKVGSPTGTLQIKIVEDNSGAPTGTVVNTQTHNVVSISTSNSFGILSKFLDPVVSLTKDKTYWLVVDYAATPTVDVDNYVMVLYNNSQVLEGMQTNTGSGFGAVANASMYHWVLGDLLRIGTNFSMLVVASNTSTSGNEILVRGCYETVQDAVNALNIAITKSSNHSIVMSVTDNAGSVRSVSHLQTPTGLTLYSLCWDSANGDLYGYVNGRQIGLDATGISSATIKPPTYPLQIGRQMSQIDTYSRWWKGVIHDIILVDGYLTSTDIAAINRHIMNAKRLVGVDI